jgi:ribosomal protein S18 acetylase RimI-like enzyme
VVSYRLREATGSDIDFLAGVVMEATRDQGRVPDGFDERQFRLGFTETTLAQFRDEISVTDVIEVDGEPVGRLRVANDGDCIELCGIQLLPQVQSHGIGTAVIEDLKQQAIAAGIPLTLGVEKDNLAARRLYERLGFGHVTETDLEYRLSWNPPDPTI